MQHIGVRLEEENGEVIERPDINFAHTVVALWKHGSEKEFPWLWAIDPYGDTVFNVHQVPRVIEELNRLLPKVEDETAKNTIRQTIDFLNKMKDFQYVRFIGD